MLPCYIPTKERNPPHGGYDVSGRRDDPVMVYSTERGLVCPKCRVPVAKCRCREEESTPAGDGIVRVRRETIVAELSRRGFTAKLAGG